MNPSSSGSILVQVGSLFFWPHCSGGESAASVLSRLFMEPHPGEEAAGLNPGSRGVSGLTSPRQLRQTAGQRRPRPASVWREEDGALARSDWSRSRTQEGGGEEGGGRRRASVQRDGRGEGRGRGRQEGRGGQGGGREGNGGSEGGGGGSEGSGEEGRREGGLHQLLSESAALLFIVGTVFRLAGFSSHSVLVPPAGNVLFQLDLGVDVDVTDLAVERLVLQAGSLQSWVAAVLHFGSGSRVSFDWAGATASLQHRFML